MSGIPEPPKDIQSIRDAAVDHVITGSPLPAEIQRLYRWIEENHYDLEDLLGSYFLLLHLKSLAEGCFFDEELRAWEGIDDDRPLTDTARVAWARKRVEEEFRRFELRSDTPLGSCFAIRKADGTEAIVGCTVEEQGPGLFQPKCEGLFRTPDLYIAALLKRGLMPADGDIDDRLILSHWQRD
jgi:hypothetical protein